uniref:Oxidoreductase NAD-binding domain containing 1 n=1 Tax=Tetraodon nigroviridis TaxID=99883 RepID=H3CUZ0_TETNG
MSSIRKMDHLERTANNYRQNALYPAQICGIMNESEVVKRLRVAVHPDFCFKAGQWASFDVRSTSSSGLFTWRIIQPTFILILITNCVYSLFPQCTVGSQVAMRVGGDFFFDPSPSDPAVDLLLVAGGVGINPLYSILLHTADLMHLNRSSGGRDYNIGSVHLSYSAKNTQELLFKSSIIEACREFPDKFSCDFHVTQQSTDVEPDLRPFLSRGRITEEELQARVDPQKTLCFLCGPPPMIEALSKTLLDSGLPKDKILFEKWW